VEDMGKVLERGTKKFLKGKLRGGFRGMRFAVFKKALSDAGELWRGERPYQLAA